MKFLEQDLYNLCIATCSEHFKCEPFEFDACLVAGIRLNDLFVGTRERYNLIGRALCYLHWTENKHEVTLNAAQITSITPMSKSDTARRYFKNHATVIWGTNNFRNLLEIGDELAVKMIENFNEKLPKNEKIIY